MARFTIRPVPEVGESIQGYLLRVAMKNGRRNISEIVRTAGYKGRSDTSSLFVLRKMLESVSPLSCSLSLEEILVLLETGDTESWVFDEHRSIQSVFLSFPRICLECFEDESTSYFKFEWSLLHNSYCDEHQQLLIDKCPQCSVQLKWESSIFSGCKVCGVYWKDCDPVSCNVDDFLQKEFKRLAKPKEAEWYDKFTSLVVRAARPYDLIHGQLIRVPDNLIDLNELLAQAKWIRDTTCLPEGLREWGPEGVVKKRRLKYIESIRFHLNYILVAQELCIPSSFIQSLVGTGLITPFDLSRKIDVMLFDSRNIRALLKKYDEVEVAGSNDLVIYEKHKLLTCYCLSYSEFLCVALKDKDTRRIGGGFKQIVIEKSTAQDMLYNTMVEKLNSEDMRANKLTKDFATSPGKWQLQDLINEGKLCYQVNSTKISGKSLLSYIQKYGGNLKKRQKVIERYLY